MTASVSTQDAAVVADGLAFPECPRWHDGRLWVSDMHVGTVCVYAPDAASASGWTAEAPALQLAEGERTGGLGFLPDGRLLAVSSLDGRLLRREPDGTVVEHAVLDGITRGWCNDMLVDGRGRAYVGSYGANFRAGEEQRPIPLALVDTDGTVRSVGDELWFPNGMSLTPDARTLIVAESLSGRLVAFTVADDGSLSEGREWSPLPEGVRPDGICLDAQGAVWISSFDTAEVLRVHEGGRISARVVVAGLLPFACALGGADRRTLLVCAARSWREDETLPARAGVVAAAAVEVPGAGWQ